ncbi:hypothetical protein HK104_010482 [Borealophlyctis nickersoniae]|nr:hypothetical protein HK104_010482 [Borealophlyctis nickersoniae]
MDPAGRKVPTMNPAGRKVPTMDSAGREVPPMDPAKQKVTKNMPRKYSTTFHVHRYVLSRAPYFEKLLLSGFAESKAVKAETSSLITLPDQFSGKTVELVLHYLYVGSAAFPSTPQPSSLVDVLFLADFLNYEPLFESCKKLIQFTSPDDTPAAIRALVLASTQMKGCEDLKTRVAHLVRL